MRTPAVLVVLLVLGLVPAAQASFPGPNGRIVFVQAAGPFARGEAPSLYLCSSDPDGSSQTRLTEAGIGPSWPVFSPAGSQLAFVNAAGGGFGLPIVARPDGTEQRTLPGGSVHYPSWSVDGLRLYASSEGDLLAVATSDGARTELTATPDRAEIYPVPSPDGTRLAYVETPDSASPNSRTLIVADPEARFPRPLVTLGAVSDPDWSPDSSRLAFANEDGIWEIKADGTGVRRLHSSGVQPAYSPDGTRIAFVDDGDIWMMAADGRGANRVIETPTSESDPAWQPGQASVRAAGRVPCAISGTSGDDVLVGTPGADVFLDIGGDDLIRGLGGNDIVVDGPGDDVIDAGDGDDVVQMREGLNRIDGGAGNDALGSILSIVGDPQILSGGPGNDELVGGFAADQLDGGDGVDRIIGLRGPDVIRGGPGDDRLQGNRGDDRLSGGLGNDVLFGGLISSSPRLPQSYDGYDLLFGDGGDDRLAGGWQRDRLFGGSGADRLVGGPQGDRLDGGPGRDMLGGNAGDDLLLARDGARDRVFGGPGFDRARVDGVDVRAVERVLRR